MKSAENARVMMLIMKMMIMIMMRGLLPINLNLACVYTVVFVMRAARV